MCLVCYRFLPSFAVIYYSASYLAQDSAAAKQPFRRAKQKTASQVLRERNFPYSNIKLLASARSAGQNVDWDGSSYTVEELTDKRCAS